MTSFVDGPAEGQKLMLHRAVKFLRVVHDNRKPRSGGWDGLDQPKDEPGPTEDVWAYQITARPGMCHVNAGKASGFYPIAEYKFCDPQPPSGMMRDQTLWQYWCEHQADPCPQWTE